MGISKNNNVLLQDKYQDKKFQWTLRKSTLGVTSVLIGATFIMTNYTVVSADTNTSDDQTNASLVSSTPDENKNDSNSDVSTTNLNSSSTNDVSTLQTDLLSETSLPQSVQNQTSTISNQDSNKYLSDPTTSKAAYTKEEADALGKIPVDFQITNETTQSQNITAQLQVYDASQQVGSTLSATKYLEKGQSIQVSSDVSLQSTFSIDSSLLENDHGYMVKVSLFDANNQLLSYKLMALAVEDDWKKFPRYGVVAGSPNDDLVITDKQLDKYTSELTEMKNMHVNSYFFYDVYQSPVDPFPSGDVTFDQEWATGFLNFAPKIDTATVKEIISQIHDSGAKAMLYNMINAKTNLDKDVSGLPGDDQLLYNAESGFGTLNEPMTNTFVNGTVSQIYYNPNSTEWQEFIAKTMKTAMDNGGFDGWQGDTIGDHLVTTYDERGTGKSFKVSSTYTDFANKIKELLGDKYYFTLNAVDADGLSALSNSSEDVVYAEIWPFNTKQHSEYGDLKRIVDQVREETGKSLIVGAYIEKGVGTQNGSDVDKATELLVDATIAAAGGYHMTLVSNAKDDNKYGVGVLTSEYYPSQDLNVSDDLNQSLYNYQQFITGYENVLRGDGVTNDDVLAKTYASNGTDEISWNHNNNENSGRFGNQVWTFTKKGTNFHTVQLINL